MSHILVINRADKWFQKEYIIELFSKFNWGEIDKVDIVTNNHNQYNSIYIYYKSWNHHLVDARHVRDYLVNQKKKLKIYYALDLYWIVEVSYRQPEKKQIYPYYKVI